MVFDLIYNELLNIYGSSAVWWLNNANYIFSYILTTIYFLAFASIPLFVLFWIISLLQHPKEEGYKKYNKKYKK